MLVYTDMIYILLFDRPVCLSQGRDILDTVICPFMKVLGLNMCTIHLGILGMISEFQCIADIDSFQLLSIYAFSSHTILSN